MEAEEKIYAPEIETDEDKENAVQCECCKVYMDFSEMKSMPWGSYCESCWDDIYG